MITLKKTALLNEHKQASAKLVEFAGYEMPIQYKGIISEHNSVRSDSGIFDVSHMGEFLISGKSALDFLNYLVPNDIKKIEQPGKGLYTQICNENGGTIDDLIIYRLEEDFIAVVNASNIEKDWKWFNAQKNKFDIQLTNISEKISLIAVQGPNAYKNLAKALNVDVTLLEQQKYFDIKKHKSMWLARTGYTGEDGFEIFIDNEKEAISLWQELIKAGVTPCGLGARDTLRLEAAYPLYGHELDDETSPLEAGLGWSIKLEKQNDFLGKEALIKQKQNGLKKKLVCLKVNDRLISRQGYKVFSKDNNLIGTICSGSQGITVGYPIATAYIPPQYDTVGEVLLIEIREKLIPATIVKRPFYKKT